MYTVKVNIWCDELYSQIMSNFEDIQSDDADPYFSCNVGFRDERSALLVCERSRDTFLNLLKATTFGKQHVLRPVEESSWQGFMCDEYGVMNWAVRHIEPEFTVTYRDYKGRRTMLVFENVDEFQGFVMTHTPEFNVQEVLAVSTREGVVYSSLQAAGDKHITIADAAEWAL